MKLSLQSLLGPSASLDLQSWSLAVVIEGNLHIERYGLMHAYSEFHRQM